MTARPLLLLDVGFAATGVAVATIHDDGPHVALDVIVPERGLSPKALHEKRACVKFGDLAERLHDGIFGCVLGATPKVDDRGSFGLKNAVVVAEVPVMGSRSAAGMRSMALALACYRVAVRCSDHYDFTRNDVLAACFGKKKPVGDGKAATRLLVRKIFVVDDSRLPVPAMTKTDRDLIDNAYDAAALLFVAREHGILRRCGWGDLSFKDAARSVAKEES